MKLAELIATFFFIGQAKIAPGSIASLFTTLVFYMFAMNLDFIIFVIIILVTIILSFFAIHFYTTDFKEKDRSEIVIDEVVGQSVALLPLLFFEKSQLKSAVLTPPMCSGPVGEGANLVATKLINYY